MLKTRTTENLVQNTALRASTEMEKAGAPRLELVTNITTLDRTPPSSLLKSRGAKHLQFSTRHSLNTPSFQWERFHQIAHELPPIFIEHWKELALNQDAIPLAPDWDKFYNLDVQGILRILTVRVEGHLVGYVFLLVSTHLHYATTLWAHADMFFLDPVARQGWTGVKLFKTLIRDVKAMGAVNLTLATKLHFSDNRVTKLLQRLGFMPIETVHSMRL